MNIVLAIGLMAFSAVLYGLAFYWMAQDNKRESL